MQRHHAVRQLVKKHGAEKQKTGQDSQRPVLGRSPLGMQLPKVHGQRIGNQAKNEQPRGIQINRNAQYSSDSKTGSANGHWPMFPEGEGRPVTCDGPAKPTIYTSANSPGSKTVRTKISRPFRHNVSSHPHHPVPSIGDNASAFNGLRLAGKLPSGSSHFAEERDDRSRELQPARRPDDVRRRCCCGTLLDVPSHHHPGDRACHGPARSLLDGAGRRPKATGPLSTNRSTPESRGRGVTPWLH